MKRLLALLLVSLLVALSATLAAGVSTAQAINPEQTTPEGVVSVLKPYVNYYFHSTLYQAGYGYRAPRVIDWVENNPASYCTLAEENGFYCDVNGEEAIYLDYTLFQGLISGSNPGGSIVRYSDDYVAGVLFVHEWGHHIARLLGWRAWALARGYYAGQELQADCYAGMFSRYARRIGLLNANDVEWARYVLYHIGDGGSRNPSYYDSTARDSHGSGAMRDYWFRVGYDQQNLTACGYSLYRAVHGA